jgi:hypothetical protein
MIDAWLAHVEAHPAEARFLFAPIAGDPEVERVQRELHARQAAAQAALLREFAPRLSETEAEPRGEIVRAGFAAIALWRLDNPAAPRSLAHDSLLRLALAMLDDAGAETRRERRKGHV